MRSVPVQIDIRRAVVLASLALIATSCSRSLPTAPASSDAVRPRLGADAFATAGLENQVAVTFAPGVSMTDLAAQYGAVLVTSEAGERTASLRPVAGQTAAVLMEQLVIDGRIVTAEPNRWMEPAEARQQSFAFDDGFGNATTFNQQPAALNLHVERAHDTATGKGVKVAIIDTGVDLMHPAIRHSIVGGWDFIANDAVPADQRDFIDNDRDGRVDEAFGHGTHVAGIVHLVAPDAQLLIVRVLDADGRGDIVNVTAGVRWAMEQGARVINLSLGSTERSDALQNVLEEAENAGVVVTSTAGNWGTDKNVDFPGRSTHTMCIAAVDANNNGASFSSYGSDIELSAPGVAVRSPYPGGGYRLWSGTSMSAPFVAGTAALLIEKHPNWGLAQTEARIQGTCRPLLSVPTGATKSQFGAGALDVGAALAPDFVLNPNPGYNEDLRPH
jgi:subtilisin family serine protease